MMSGGTRQVDPDERGCVKDLITAQGTSASTDIASVRNVTAAAVLRTSSLDFELTHEQLAYVNMRPSLVREMRERERVRAPVRVCACVCVCVCE